ncbi:hypothetical protein DAPPUDRAFT_239157 [Daphnia pulex]|uniref:Uncharacterized protein n=1 Tax=Daphnia pulex TaxID=6669 RepID=E9G8H7_DAPPU|nr:hypothetical protein DAPPUDRAFT_239157 [Daphnia pulex]|eukprot:EFX83976.1 hypothetical protein DAPPUDRAFT_239157 [Daphnia pulex]
MKILCIRLKENQHPGCPSRKEEKDKEIIISTAHLRSFLPSLRVVPAPATRPASFDYPTDDWVGQPSLIPITVLNAAQSFNLKIFGSIIVAVCHEFNTADGPDSCMSFTLEGRGEHYTHPQQHQPKEGKPSLHFLHFRRSRRSLRKTCHVTAERLGENDTCNIIIKQL